MKVIRSNEKRKEDIVLAAKLDEEACEAMVEVLNRHKPEELSDAIHYQIVDDDYVCREEPHQLKSNRRSGR